MFETYESSDNTLSLELANSVPSRLDWLYVESLVIFLKTFFEMTIRISGSLYVTSNSFLSEISDFSCIIADMLRSKSNIEEVCVFSFNFNFRSTRVLIFTCIWLLTTFWFFYL